MTVRAVDMQTMIPRLNEASRLQHQAEQQPQLAQHVRTAVEQARVERAQSQVNAKMPTEHATTVKRDGGGQSGGGGGQPQPRARKDGKAGAKEQQPTEPGRGHKLDVKV
ncbi:MAG TPA: hypothetical protein VNT75_11165 [Symbiobacteriaceae bacterium]|nr:hypothetical protein [Symbiobacteriaceae bacterium]